MGKRNKEQNVGRRRPMIQLGSARKSVGVVSRITAEENNTDDKVNSTNDPMDDQLAGFLAEINSMELPTQESNESQSKQAVDDLSTVTDTSEGTVYDPNNFDPSSQGHLLPDPWEACYDESTSYYYYWNKVSNEVQWYPPPANLPPPPPPPPFDESQTDISNSVCSPPPEEPDVSENITSPPTEEEIPSTKENIIIAENEIISEEGDNKEKDKELMNKIKEKIQKKKEEKLRKEQEEKMLKEKDKEDLLQVEQQKKEDMLREKLIKKKLEREKVLSESPNSEVVTPTENEVNINKTVNEAVSATDFSVDIFAEENATNSLNQAAVYIDIQKEKQETKTEKSDLKDDNPPSIPNAAADGKETNWRIVDSVYDDDEDDEEKVEVESNVSTVTVNKTKVEVEGMEDYADMLLEDGISDREEPDDTVIVNPLPPLPTLPNDTLSTPLPPVEAPPPLPDHDIRPPLPQEDEPLPELPKMSPEDEEESRREIGRISTELFEKLNFLGITNKNLKSLEIYLIELETRNQDWQAGALDTKYFQNCLTNISGLILKHEETAAPTGWICHWSNEFKMYYYHNSATGASQWEYPNIQTDFMTNAATEQQLPDYHAMMPMLPTPYMDPSILMAANPSLVSPAHGYTREPVPNTQTKKRTAQDTTVLDPYRDPYRSTKRKKDSDSTTDDAQQLNSGNDSGTSSPLPKTIAAAPVIRARESSPSVIATPPLPLEDNVESYSPQPPKDEQPLKSTKPKLKKKKKLDSGGLPSKKLKQVSSLVQKWQTVKQKVEDEKKVELESDNETYEEASERRIVEWRKEMETSGRKKSNPNFTEIKGDWKERLKRKT